MFLDLTNSSISFNVPNNSLICSSGTALGPSDKASFGFGCVSIKTPKMPEATAALASKGTYSLCPPLLSPLPPGC